MKANQTIKSLILSLVLGVACFGASAAGVTAQTTISQVTTTNYGVMLFYMTNGTIPGTPACNSGQRFAIDTTLTANNALVAALLGAAAGTRTVQVIGTGTCSVDGSSETVNNLYVF